MSDAITERIKKLLRLAADRRGNAHEAERALAMAFELAEKHRVEIESLDLDEKSSEVVHEYIRVGQRFDRIRREVFGILQSFFHVSVVLCYERMMMVGRREDVVIATYVHDFLLRAARNCLSNYATEERKARRRMSSRKRAGFITGFFYGVISSLREAREATPLTDSRSAIVVAEESRRKSYIEVLIGKTQSIKPLPEKRNESAVWKGYKDRAKTKINQPLAGGPGGGQLALL